MGIPFTETLGFLLTVTMGFLFTMSLGFQLTISTRSSDLSGSSYKKAFSFSSLSTGFSLVVE